MQWFLKVNVWNVPRGLHGIWSICSSQKQKTSKVFGAQGRTTNTFHKIRLTGTFFFSLQVASGSNTFWSFLPLTLSHIVLSSSKDHSCGIYKKKTEFCPRKFIILFIFSLDEKNFFFSWIFFSVLVYTCAKINRGKNEKHRHNGE